MKHTRQSRRPSLQNEIERCYSLLLQKANDIISMHKVFPDLMVSLRYVMGFSETAINLNEKSQYCLNNIIEAVKDLATFWCMTNEPPPEVKA